MPMPSRLGRPPKPVARRKQGFIKIRLEISEKEAFQKAADIGGIPLSAWIRERLRGASIRELEEIGVRAPFLADLYPKE